MSGKLRTIGIFAAAIATFSFMPGDKPQQRMIDDFAIKKKWDAQTIENNYSKSPVYHVGLWSKPIEGPTFRLEGGRGLFTFPKLGSYPIQGFQLAYHLVTSEKDGLAAFEGDNYLSFLIANKSPEAVWMHFRVFEDMRYTHANGNVLTDAMVELKSDKDTIILPANSQYSKVTLKLSRPVLEDKDILSPKYNGRYKFFAFETGRVKKSTDKDPGTACTLLMDNLMLEDTKTGK